MKKNKFNLLLAGFLSLAMVGCTSETSDVLGNGNEVGATTDVTIEFPYTGSGVSYATTGTAAENKVEEIAIFAVNTTGGGVSKMNFAENQFTIDGTKASVKVSLTVGATYNFYAVANAAADPAGLVNAPTYVAPASTMTTEAAVKNGVSNAILAELPKPSLLMSGTGTGTITGTGKIEVTLKRRMARFDVLNNSAETGFSIAKIHVTNAVPNGTVFDGGTGKVADAKLEATETYNGANGATTDAGMFYMYPTKVGSGTGHTHIIFEDTDGKLHQVINATGLDIAANKIYTIKLSKTTTGEDGFEWGVDDWETGGEFGGTEVVSSMSTTMASTALNGAKITGTTIDMTAATGSVIATFETYSSTSASATLTPNSSAITVVNSTAPAVGSYATAWVQKHTISITNQASGTHTLSIEDSKGTSLGSVVAEYGVKFVNPLARFTKANLGSDYKIGADLTAETAGLTTSYGGWFQWGRKAAFTNPSKGDPDEPVGYNSVIATTKELDGKFYGGTGMYTWHTQTGTTDDIWTSILGQGTIDSDPCKEAGNYRVPTVNEWLAVIPYNSTVGNYTSATGKGDISVDSERTGNQITALTGPSKYVSSGEGKVLYAVKRMGVENEAYALRWSYVGTGTAFADQMITEGGDTYLEIVCIPVSADFKDGEVTAASLKALDWGKDAEVRLFPASGYRHYQTGIPSRRGLTGDYASSTGYAVATIWRLGFNASNINWGSAYRTYGLSVRCVAYK